MKKQALVVQSGGFDSALCLYMAKLMYGAPAVYSLSFDYGQRHRFEVEAAKAICQSWSVDHRVISLPALAELTENSLTNLDLPISYGVDGKPNTLVVGRNGLMAHLAALCAHQIGAHAIYLGVIADDGKRCGYRDCDRFYMDKIEELLRIDLNDSSFAIHTPLVALTKFQAMELAEELGILPFLLSHTISCYEGLFDPGCGSCPACLLRQEARLRIEEKGQRVSSSAMANACLCS